MKRFLLSMSVLGMVTSSVCAQGAADVEGVPAKMVTPRGTAPVILHKIEAGTITFNFYKSKKVQSAPAAKITGLQFITKYDDQTAFQAFIAANYDEVIQELEPVLEPLLPYMTISNNMQQAAAHLMVAYRETERWDRVEAVASLFEQSGQVEYKQMGIKNLFLAALGRGDVEKANTLAAGLDDEAGALFFKAQLARAQQDPKQGTLWVCELIRDHGNNMTWMPDSEFLSAQLYADAAKLHLESAELYADEDNAKLAEAETNQCADYLSFAIGTANQAAAMYAGTHIAGDAKKLVSGLELELEKLKVNEGESDE